MDQFDDGPEHAAALFEWVVPDFPAPVAVRREAPTLCGIPTWGVEGPGGRAYRLKVASGPNGQALVRRGAALLGLLTARGVPLPSSVTVRAAFPGAEVSVALETRLGTSDGRTAWGLLGAEGRLALAADAANGLWLLHRLSTADLGPWGLPSGGVPSSGVVRPLRDALLGKVERQVARVRDDGRLPSSLLRDLEARVRSDADRMPAALERRPIHGSFALDTLAVQRRAYAGMRDLEGAGAGDVWEDVATFLVSTGDPDAAATRKFVEVYRSHVPTPADLRTRIDLYEGLVLLRVLARACEDLHDPDWSALEEATEGYVATPAYEW